MELICADCGSEATVYDGHWLTMVVEPRRFVAPFALVLLVGCSAPSGGEELATASLAVNVCDEVVPDNRSVDGIPAYAQCDATMSGAIWSNDGVETSATSGGADWVQTQRSGGYQCTELAYRYMRFRWNVSYRSGDAHEWCDGTLPSNLVKSTTPVHGDLMVFAGGACGADATTGHIAVVDTVDAARATVTIVEENRAGRRSANQSCATCFLHAVENDGSGGAAGTGGAATGGAATGGRSSGGAGNGGSGTAGSMPGGGAGAASAGSAGASGSPGASGAAAGGASGASSAAGSGSGMPTGGAPSATGGANGAGGPPVAGNAGMPNAGASSTATDATDELDADAGCALSPAGTRRGSVGSIVAAALALVFVGRRRRR